MYTEFYGLKEKPFNLTPSPRFVYMSEGHREAMALLTYGVTERKGFILLTGEVGTGKTTMIHNLLEGLDSGVEYVYLVNPLLSPQEFIDYLAFSAFKKRIHFRSKADFLVEFEDFLKTCLQHQKVFILIIDEAHKLSFELLEEIRLLSNMEYAEEKLINIFLVGQPELNENLNSPKGRATLQRIGIRYDIPPLTLKEAGEYLETRLLVAGAPKRGEIFQKDAIEAIHRLSQGYPRTINILADNALLLGYSKDKKTINASMIEECYNSMQLKGSFLKDSRQETPDKEQVAAPAPDPARNAGWRWAVALFLIIVIIMSALFLINRSGGSIPGLSAFIDGVKSPDTSAPVTPDTKGTSSDEPGGYAVPSHGGTGDGMQGAGSQSVGLAGLRVYALDRGKGEGGYVIAKEGDTMTSLAEEIYGHSGEEELSLLEEYNPEIPDIDKISIGQRVSFPVYTVLIAAYDSQNSADILYRKLKEDGFDANLLVPGDDDRDPSYRVTVGAFRNKREAESFASDSLEGRVYSIPR